MPKLEFDPKAVGASEYGWWRAHNDKNKAEMLRLLTEQNILLFGFTPQEAQEALRSFAEGVKFHDTREWNKAVEAVARYYDKIKQKTGLSFDSRQVASLEVGWWQLHNELEHNPDKSRLANAFAELYAAIFGIDKTQLIKAGQLKAAATYEHDLAEDPATPQERIESHWQKAKENLVAFYEELSTFL